MDKERFELFLLKKYNNKNVISNAISRCGRVERCLNINLDEMYKKDCCEHLLETLEYSKDDFANNKPTPTGITIKGNSFEGMASLRNAVRRYVEYCQSIA
ncbi:MAG: hypothetical protein IKP37_11310 [Paludibacteraceae bacterium]|nr:hypothetical protein [Paludibacteraceae bacterium]